MNVAKLIALDCSYFTDYCIYQLLNCTNAQSNMLESFYEWFGATCIICENNIDMNRIIFMDARIHNGITDGMFVNINGGTIKKVLENTICPL